MQTIYEEESSDSGAEADTEVDNNSDSTTVTPSVTDYIYENGRRYHRYREGSYLLPNDETEQERLHLCHKIWSLLLNDEPWKVPLEHPQKVLDIGCGTGDWAIMIGEQFPSATVIGTDLSPIQPTLVPRNVKFYVEDAEDEWTFEKGLDLVHGRMLAGSISDWTKFFRQAFGQLKPGGWIEMNEFEAKFYYHNQNGEQSEQLNMLVKIFNKHSSDIGKGFNDVLLIPEAMRNAGFGDVEVNIQQVGTLLSLVMGRWLTCQVPIGTWHKDKPLRKVGDSVHYAAVESIEPYILAIGTRILLDPAESVREIVRATRDSLDSRNYELYAHAHFIWGRRPKYN
jgi:SAM-dependent methyltransferase